MFSFRCWNTRSFRLKLNHFENCYFFPSTVRLTLNVILICAPHTRHFSGLLTTLCCCPFEQRDGFRVLASKFRNTIYLHKDETEEQKRQRMNSNERMKMMGSWGYKFEDFILKNSPLENEAQFKGLEKKCTYLLFNKALLTNVPCFTQQEARKV